MFTELKYLDPQGSMIWATRADGTQRVFEPSDVDMWAALTAGTFGAIADYVAPTVDMNAVKAAAKHEINLLAGAARARFITIIPGQEMLYLEKKAEALRWLSAQSPDIADYPFLGAEVNITAATPNELANLWMQMAAQWAVAASIIEGMRMAYINNVNGAADVATIDAMLETYRPLIAAVHP